MDNGLIFPYQLDRANARPGKSLIGGQTSVSGGTGRVTDGVTQEARRSQALVVLG